MLTGILDALCHHTVKRTQQFVRKTCRVAFVLILWGWPVTNGLSSTLPDFPNIKQQLGTVPVNWGGPQNMVVGGVPISTLPFVSSHSAIDVASRFSGEGSIFQRVLSMPGQLILSGVKDDWHWVAVLSGDSAGASGYVSAMSTISAATTAPPAWMQPGLAPAFSIGNSEAQHVVQQVHHLPGSHDAVRDGIMDRLVNLGWKRQSDLGELRGQWTWNRNEEQLSVLMLPYSGGTLVFTQQQMRGKP